MLEESSAVLALDDRSSCGPTTVDSELDDKSEFWKSVASKSPPDASSLDGLGARLKALAGVDDMKNKCKNLGDIMKVTTQRLNETAEAHAKGDSYEQDSQIKHLESLIASDLGFKDMGNALAAKFRRDGNGAKSEEYKTLMTNPERGAFRKTWLAAHI